MGFGYFLHILDHVCICRMQYVLREAKNAACDGIYRTDNRQRHIKIWFPVSQRKNVLFQGKVSAVNAITFKRMMGSKKNELF